VEACFHQFLPVFNSALLFATSFPLCHRTLPFVFVFPTIGTFAPAHFQSLEFPLQPTRSHRGIFFQKRNRGKSKPFLRRAQSLSHSRAYAGTRGGDSRHMQWIAPSEKDAANAALEKRLWDAADPFRTKTCRRMKVIKPPVKLIAEFSRIVDPLFDGVNMLKRQIQNLRRTRDLLLPRLLSGQIELL
jgi:hypothetical protein